MSRTPRPTRLFILAGLILLVSLLTPQATRQAVLSLVVSYRSTVHRILLVAATIDVLFLTISWRSQFRERYFFAREQARENVFSALRILLLLMLLTLLVSLLPRFVP